MAGAAEATYAVALLNQPPDNPDVAALTSIFASRAYALTLLAAGLGWALLRERRRTVAVARLAEEVGSGPAHGSLRDRLASSLGDDTLQVAYWLPGPGQYVDASGVTVGVRPARGQATTHVVRAGEPVAVVVHDRALYAGARLEREIGSAARLVLDNERLQAALRAQLEDLRASRARIVETSDHTRRHLERDLHDGAQQRLLAVALELRLARAAAAAAGDSTVVSILELAVEDAQAAIVELRDVAHGIFPAILEQAGLGPALSYLADRARVPVEVTALPEHRLPADVERAVYLVGRAALETAQIAGGELVQVAVVHDGGGVVVSVDGVQRGEYRDLVDRVGALGGRLRATDGHLRAEIPCA